MTQADEQDRVLERYLLGGLTEAEEARLEREYLAAAETQARLLLAEADLVDGYASGRLAAGERARLEAGFLCSPRGRRRAELARGLVRLGGPRHGRRRLVIVQVVAMAAVVLWPRTAAVPAIALRPGVCRGEGGAVQVPRRNDLTFELELPADHHARYRVALIGARDEVTWSVRGLVSHARAARRVVGVVVPVALAGGTEQLLTLAGEDGRPIAAYVFTVAP